MEKDGSLTVLLNASLKSQNTAALVCFGEDWYGVLQSSFDLKLVETKKKSALVLSIFTPGQEVVHNIMTKLALAAAKAAEPGSAASQAVKSVPNSYSKGCIVWYRENNLVVSSLNCCFKTHFTLF